MFPPRPEKYSLDMGGASIPARTVNLNFTVQGAQASSTISRITI
jgi:hypothetical protein